MNGFLFVVAGRERPERDDEVLQFEHRASRFDALHAARGRLPPSFGRAGDHDVARLRDSRTRIQVA